MYHIIEKVESSIEVKKSKFICLLLPINDEKQIKDKINEVKRLYPGATHYCYGCSINGNYRSNDDGEPASTAGKPILQCLINSELDNVLAVVVRYFGGTLLGTAGLVKAYQQATIDAINQAKLATPTLVNNYKITVNYQDTNKIEYFLAKNGTIKLRDYQQDAIYYFQCENDICQQISELTNGSGQVKLLNSEIIEKVK